MIVVVGIDPGVASTGFGAVCAAGNRLSAIDGGVIEAPPGEAVERRLRRIHQELTKLLSQHEPVAVALEDVYFGKNVRSAIAVGQARGVTLLAAAEHDVSCFDYTPQAVKMAVCGSGSASKKQVQRMVGILLGVPQPKSDHTADALAVAICHAARARSSDAFAIHDREARAG
jgi:crossover junction endodeoxyribonuclease RuvC